MLVSMKALKTISGFSGAVLLIYWLLGIIFDFHVSFYFFIAGLILFGLVYFPLTLLDKHRRENRWDTIRGDKKEQPHSQAEGGKKKPNEKATESAIRPIAKEARGYAGKAEVFTVLTLKEEAGAPS